MPRTGLRAFALSGRTERCYNEIVMGLARICAAALAAVLLAAASAAPAAPDPSGAPIAAVADSAAARPTPGEGSLDVRAFRLLNGRAANPVFDAAMPLVTDLDRWRVAILIAWGALALFGGAKGRRTALLLIPLIAASDQIASSVVKPLVERMRPCEVLGGVHLWYGPEGWMTTPAEVARSYKSSFSFPSSHAANITASMLFLGLAYRRLLVPLVLIAAVVGYSRIYIGVHWPSDVLAGAALGAALAGAAYAAFRKIYPREREGAVLTRRAPDTPPSE